MKRGCFLSSVFVLTISVGVVVYFVKYKSESFKPYLNKFAGSMMMNDIEKKMKNIKVSEGKDSLTVIINEFKSKKIKNRTFDTQEIQDFVEKFNEITRNDTVYASKLNELKKYIK